MGPRLGAHRACVVFGKLLALSEPKEEAVALWNYGGRVEKQSPNLGIEKFLLQPVVVREAARLGRGPG